MPEQDEAHAQRFGIDFGNLTSPPETAQLEVSPEDVLNEMGDQGLISDNGDAVNGFKSPQQSPSHKFEHGTNNKNGTHGVG